METTILRYNSLSFADRHQFPF